jgi:rod shape-determining protein MreD
VVLLAFWGVHQPLRVGMGIAFLLGLCMDVQQSSLLGQHALAYTVLLYGTRRTHRRVLWFRPGQQSLQMAGLFGVAHAVVLLVGVLAGGVFPGWSVLAAPVLEAMLWPLASWVLLAPQRRAPDSNDKRAQ